MSRQFRLYALPSDIEPLVAELRTKVGAKIIQATAHSPEPIEVNSPIHKWSPLIRTKNSVRADCYLIPATGADVRLSYYPTQSCWHVVDSSEVIEFTGCDYDEKILVCGRFYYQDDMLVGGAICPKRREFVQWANRIFATAKRVLHRSKSLDAYVGEGAEKWRQRGGRFATLLIPGREPIFAVERE